MVNQVRQCYKRGMSFLEAEMVISRNNSGFRSRNRREVRHYYCNECRTYHLTSQKKEKWGG
jgi:hypothetical protein